ncbi:PCMD domain-containing protein [Coprobacter sp.]
MKNKWLYILFVLFVFMISSCIKEEAPNVEADIEDIMIPDMSSVTNIKIDQNRVSVFLKSGRVDRTNLEPSFVLSDGATIAPVSSGKLDFTKPQKYIVTSENKQWSKTYTVVFLETEIPLIYRFEYWVTDRWDEVYEHSVENIGGEDISIDQFIWASGNLGFSLVVKGGPKDFPTFKATSVDVHSGEGAACLKTRKTGSLGAAQGMPIAAGNLFLGEFTSKGINIMKEPMKATHFGVPFCKKPTAMSVWFKYDGSNVNMSYDNKGDGTIFGDGRDYCAVYAVLYDNVKAKNLYGVSYLDGNTILKEDTDNPIIAIAGLHEQIDNADQYGTNGEYKHRIFNFKYRDGKSIDPDRLKNYEYSLAVVFSSSFYGDRFIGGVGNTLWIDDVEIVCDEN